MPQDPHVRDKFICETKFAMKAAREYFRGYPKDRFDTVVESWRDVQYDKIEFVIKRLRDAKLK